MPVLSSRLDAMVKTLLMGCEEDGDQAVQEEWMDGRDDNDNVFIISRRIYENSNDPSVLRNLLETSSVREGTM